MFGPPGHAYVYRSYGIHWCLNFVCEAGGNGERRPDPRARADRRPRDDARPPRRRRRARALLRPGKLCQALGITREHDGLPLDEPPFALFGRADEVEIVAGPRIGITRAAERPWRYALAGSRFVSRPTSGRRRRGSAAARALAAKRDQGDARWATGGSPRSSGDLATMGGAIPGTTTPLPGDAPYARDCGPPDLSRRSRPIEPRPGARARARRRSGRTPCARAGDDQRHRVVRREPAALGYWPRTMPSRCPRLGSPVHDLGVERLRAEPSLRDSRAACRRRSARPPRSACSSPPLVGAMSREVTTVIGLPAVAVVELERPFAATSSR